RVGTRQQVIIDEVHGPCGKSDAAGAGAPVAKGRTRGDAPEIDGVVHVASRRPLRRGGGAAGGVGSARGDRLPMTGGGGCAAAGASALIADPSRVCPPPSSPPSSTSRARPRQS